MAVIYLTPSYPKNRNSGRPSQCTKLYKDVVTKYAPFDARLQQALDDAEGKSTGHESGSQGWILRHAMDAVQRAPPRDGVVINREAKVTAADNAATNGVVHIIDTVLIPPKTSAKPTKNIVELAQGTDSLSTLVTALTAGNLVTALEGNGPFTVFAPSNAAFAKVPAAELTRLLDPKNVQDLATILKYHVVSGAAVYSKDLKRSQSVETLEGGKLLVESASRGQMMADMQRAIRMGVPLWYVDVLVCTGTKKQE